MSGAESVYQIMGAYDFDISIVIGKSYKHILNNAFLPIVLNFRPCTIFQQDFSLPRNSSKVKQHLDEKSPNLLVGNRSPTPWPPQYLNLTPPVSSYGIFRR